MTLERTYSPPSPSLWERIFHPRPTRDAESSLSHRGRKLAYLVSHYPKVSHTFIRREILALEQRGWQVARLSIRGWDGELVDPADRAELEKTTFVLKGGMPSLAAAVLSQAVRAPRRFLSGLALALRMMRSSDRPAIWHLIYLAEACWIAPRLVRQDIRHLHAHFGTNPAEVAMLVSVLAEITYSFTVHGPEEFDRAPAIHLGEKIRRSAFVVAISSYCRSQLYRNVEQHYWDKIRVVHCGIDTGFSALETVTPCEAPRLVCVGRLCGEKGQLLLVQAAAVLAREGHKFKLVLVGDGELRPTIAQFIHGQGLAGHVEMIGWASADRVKQEMLAARAMVLPSFAEGLPIVLIEAMILGRPVLTTYVAGIPELVVDGRTGWLFPAGSLDELVKAMQSCLETSGGTLKVMGELARIRALERHGIDEQANGLTALFEAAMS
ncbi:MAG TPA: glycosyltransferase family 4 protein [Rhizomicrobium sp.]|nr:glycosyltransferase family 4 protein [Rhizomicrobium sp.]